MELKMLKCPDCNAAFGVDQEAVKNDEIVDCPVCGTEVDLEEDRAEIR